VALCLLLSTTACPLSVSNSHCTVCWFLCHYVYCSLLQPVHCLSVPHTVPSVGFVSLYLLLSPSACPLSVSTSHCNVCWFCVTISTAFYFSLSTVCQYLTLYRLLVLCHYIYCFLLQPVHCLSVPHTVPSVGFVSLYLLLSTSVCPLSVSTSHCTVCWFCDTMSTASYYSLSTVCQYLTLYRLCTIFLYLTLYRLLVLCHYVYCSLLQPVHCLSLPHTVPSKHCLSVPYTVPSVGFVSLCLLLSSTASPLSVSTSHCTVYALSFCTSHCTVCWFCVTMSTALFYSLSTVCQYLTLYRLCTIFLYLTLYRLLVLCHYVYCLLLQSVHCLSVPHTVPSVGFVSLCLLMSSSGCPLTLSTSHCTVCCVLCHYIHADFYILSTVCQYLALYNLLVLCHYVHCCLLQYVHCLSVPHTVQSVVFCVTISTLISTFCPLSVSISHFTICWFCATMSTAVFYSMFTVCQYLTLYNLLCSLSLYPLLSFIFCPLSVSTSHFTICWFCATMSPAVFYSMSTVFQYLTLYILLCSVSLYPLLSFIFCPLSVNTSHFTVCWFCATMSPAVVYSMSTVFQYLTLYSLLCSVSLYPLLSSTFCPLSVSTSHCTFCWFCATMSTAVFYSMSTDCQYLTLYILLCSVSLYPLLSSTFCPLSVSTSHFTVCWFCATMSTAVFYNLSTVSLYLTLYCLLALCHYVHCCLLQSVHCLSVPHIEFADSRQTAHYPAAVIAHTALG